MYLESVQETSRAVSAHTRTCILSAEETSVTTEETSAEETSVTTMHSYSILTPSDSPISCQG